ncbi:D-beta-hydroxybutyrate dehydrogenase, mitochondrial-like isoform X2 [Portunus trituberculatus]|uniref:D-beta-hydroxybutyrate dehydrogenase, mitochondrial-like isoform X2 n=1 Tax=Portunus trituberculatus TaxID=210409 RepID=UPI001E1CECDF|nr:D-beta-hydroxybutyrate dehydrogenase, mitochondrial-like isoform X2 [Portunus trituberculatus]
MRKSSLNITRITGTTIDTSRVYTERKPVKDSQGAKMAWSFDKTGEVILWGAVSGGVALLLKGLGFSFCSWIFIGCWFLSAATALQLSCIKVPAAGKAVVVTGCDHGIGHALALHLHQQGFRVFAGCLNDAGEGAARLREQHSERLIVLPMDVTKQEQLNAAVQEVKLQLPEREVLWGLVNNAAIMSRGYVEWVPLHTYRKIIDVNVLGMLAATKAFLPLIRRARGRVVNMSSVSGVIGTGILSPYTISKYAVEGLSDCLRQEMRQWGVAVCAVEPSNFNAATQLLTATRVENEGLEMWESMPEVVRSDYGKHHFDSVMRVLRESVQGGEKDLTPVLAALTEALTQRFPRARYRVVDTYYFLKVAAAIHLPEWMFDLLYLP